MQSLAHSKHAKKLGWTLVVTVCKVETESAVELWIEIIRGKTKFTNSNGYLVTMNLSASRTHQPVVRYTR